MKKTKTMLIIAVAVILAACNKALPPEPQESTTLEVSKSERIRKQEPVIFKVSNTNNENVTWTITPDQNNQLKTSGNVASALFHKAGNYTIKGVVGNTQYSKVLHVIDSVYVPPIAAATLVPLKDNEKLKVTYTVNDSIASNKPDILLILNFTTTQTYPTQNNYLLTSMIAANHMIIHGVYVPEIKFQTNNVSQASGGSVFRPVPGAKSNPIIIEMSGVKYQGYYYVENKQLYVNWAHSDKIEFIGVIKY